MLVPGVTYLISRRIQESPLVLIFSLGLKIFRSQRQPINVNTCPWTVEFSDHSFINSPSKLPHMKKRHRGHDCSLIHFQVIQKLFSLSDLTGNEKKDSLLHQATKLSILNKIVVLSCSRPRFDICRRFWIQDTLLFSCGRNIRQEQSKKRFDLTGGVPEVSNKTDNDDNVGNEV